MTYPFVQAYHDLGPRKGPYGAVNVHMAEGGGTVGFLSRQNGDGVSVHYVIEYSGRIVQMLREDHMQSAIRIKNTDGSYAIRQDMDGMWGHKVAVAVLGAWADTHTTLGPNHATIGVEIEGFRATGPNAAQHDALAHLVADIRTRHPKIGTTGHRDHNVKGCPGSFIQWARLGGHGPYAPVQEEADMKLAHYRPGQKITIKPMANIRADAKLGAQVYRTLTAEEDWVIFGDVVGDVDPDGGSNVWYVRWGFDRFEFTAKSNVTAGPTAVDCKAEANTAYDEGVHDALAAATNGITSLPKR